MSRIDELQRLHEAATPGTWHAVYGCSVFASDGGAAVLHCKSVNLDQIAALHNSWPAIHRVLLAARRADKTTSPKALEIALRDLWIELRSLDGDKGAT